MWMKNYLSNLECMTKILKIRLLIKSKLNILPYQKFIPYELRYLIKKFNDKLDKHLNLSEIVDPVKKEYKKYYNV